MRKFEVQRIDVTGFYNHGSQREAVDNITGEAFGCMGTEPLGEFDNLQEAKEFFDSLDLVDPRKSPCGTMWTVSRFELIYWSNDPMEYLILSSKEKLDEGTVLESVPEAFMRMLS